MFRNLCTKLFIKKPSNLNIITIRSSALFINGPKATDNYVFITPQVDLNEYLMKKEEIQAEIYKRKVNIDLNKLENLKLIYDELKTRMMKYETRKEEVTKTYGDLIKDQQTGDNVERLKIQVKLLKENIKKIKEPLWSAEEAVILEALKVPVRLHNLTPDNSRNIIFEYALQPSNNKNHLRIGKEKGLITYAKNGSYYLKGEAAVFELGAKFFFSRLLKEYNYTQFSNPDFVKSLIIEGCGEDHTRSDRTFILDHNEQTKVNVDSRLHLTGGASLYSFFAYHAKNALHGKVFPIKYYSIGRQYTPSTTKEDNLFNTTQSSVIHIFSATKNSLELDEMLYSVIENIKSIYNQLGLYYRLSFVPASELNIWESLRLVIEMYSSSQKNYIEVGNVSLSGDFISKRLLFTYTEDKQNKYPHILSGTVLNVQKLLAGILEQDEDFILPEKFKIENWSNDEIKTI